MATFLVTGANRGIGLEFVRQLVMRREQVIATCRNPAAADVLAALAAPSGGRVRLEQLDLAEPESIARLAARVGEPIDVLVNNAALLGPGHPQLLGHWQDDAFLDAFRANALGPARLTEALLPAIERGSQRRIVFLGSAAGSASMLQPPANLYAYRASKAALHLIARNLSLDLQGRSVIVALINPGLVDTRGLLDLAPDDPGPPDLAHLVKLVRAGVVPLIRPRESVAGMLKLIDAWDMSRTGSFVNYDGTALPW